MRGMPRWRRVVAPLLPVLLAALSLVACGDDAKNPANKKKPEAAKAPAELSWQVRQVRINEPCPRSAASPAPVAAEPAAATPGPAPAATPAPVPPAPAGGETPAAGGETPAPAGDEAAPAPAVATADLNTCVRFSAVYPEFEQGMPRALLQRLNDAVKELSTSPSFDERRAGSLDGTGRKLVAAWKGRIQEKNGEIERWYDERKVDILFRDEAVISFRFTEKLKAGGAHELATVLYVSYALDRVDRLSMADLFVEGSAQKLNQLGEKKFRELRGLPPGRSLLDAGFDFPGGIFRLSSNFAVTAEGLVFRYNPYDIGPFALGETEVLLETAEIEELLRPKGPLGRRIGGGASPAAPAHTPPPAKTDEAPEKPGNDSDIGGG